MATDNLMAGIAGGLTGVSDILGKYFDSELKGRQRRRDLLAEQDIWEQRLPLTEASNIRVKQAEVPIDIAKEQRALQSNKDLKLYESGLPARMSSQTPDIPVLKSEAIKMAQQKQKLPVNAKIVDDTIDARADDRSGERKDARMATLITRFNADTNVRKYQSSIDSANNVIELIDSNNPLADQAVPTYMARASGEVGNLSEPDKAPFGGSQALAVKLNQVYENIKSGKLTSENRQFVRQLAETMRTTAVKNKSKYADKVSAQYEKIGKGSYGTRDEIRAMLSDDLGVGGDDKNVPTVDDKDPLGILK